MKIRFSISRKLTLSFGVLLIAVLTTSFLTYRNLDENLQLDREIVNIHTPSQNYLNDLHFMISNSNMLIKNWVYISKDPDAPDRVRLDLIHSLDYPNKLKELKHLSKHWTYKDQADLKTIINKIDTLFDYHKEIKLKLNTRKSYDNLSLTIDAANIIDKKITPLTTDIIGRLSKLRDEHVQIVKAANIKMERSFAAFQRLIFLMAIILFVAIVSIAVALSRTLVTPINHIQNIISNMGRGKLPKQIKNTGSDEIGDMGEALNTLVNGLRKTSEFAIKIGEGDYKSDFTPLSEEDELGNSLLLMRKNLQKASEDTEMRRLENAQRSWASQGIAEFAELMRDTGDDLEEFSRDVLFKLVRYLDVQLGGLYVLEEEDDHQYLEMKSFYAYDRHKFIEKKIEVGENLVGECVQEQETIYLTDIPADYVRIVSGLGTDSPSSLLVVPLKINDQVYGAVELASFAKIEPYKIEFIEKISETIAANISSVKIKIKTTKLLAESNDKSERLSNQEEEVRRNIEKLKASQEELIRKEKEDKMLFQEATAEYKEKIKILTTQFEKQQAEYNFQKRKLENNLKAIENSIGTYELNFEGKILSVNKKFAAMSEFKSDELVGKNIKIFMSRDRIDNIEFEKLLREIRKGKIHKGGHQYYFRGKEKWFYETFTPVKNDSGELFKIIVLSNDISKVRMNEILAKQKIEELRHEIEILKK